MPQDAHLRPGWLARDVERASRQADRDRLAQIEREIADCHQWGAKLTALNEERCAIRRNLNLET